MFLLLDCCAKKGVSDPCISKLCKPDLLTNVPPVEILRCVADFDKVQQCLVGRYLCCENAYLSSSVLHTSPCNYWQILHCKWTKFRFFCLGQRDHTPCCKRNSLPDVCLPLCAGQIMNNSVDYISCVIRMPIINACIQEGRGQF